MSPSSAPLELELSARLRAAMHTISKHFSKAISSPVSCAMAPQRTTAWNAQALQRSGCNAHARRKLVAALRGGICGLCVVSNYLPNSFISKQSRSVLAGRPAQRLERRQRAEDRRQWAQARKLDIEPKSQLGQAVRYMSHQ